MISKRVSTTFWFVSVKTRRQTRRKRFAAACVGLLEAIHLDLGGGRGAGRRCKVVSTPSPSVAHLVGLPASSLRGASRLSIPSALPSADAVCQAAKRHVDGGLCPEIKQYAVTRREVGRGG